MWIRFVAYNYWVSEGCFTVMNVSINRASTIFSLTQLAIHGLHCHILPKWMRRSALEPKRQMTCTLPHPKKEHRWSVNDLWHCIMDNPEGCAATLTHNSTVGRLATQQWWRQHRYYVLKMSVNRASMTFGHASWKIKVLCNQVYP